MNLSAIGCSFRTAPVEIREKFAFEPSHRERALTDLTTRHNCEAVILSTCNRVELYLAPNHDFAPIDAEAIAAYLGELFQQPAELIRPHLYAYRNSAAVTHIFRVISSLDSLIIGEGQIAGQMREAFEFAQQIGTTGAMLNTLYQHAVRTSKRVRTETGIAAGHASVSSVAVDFVRQVFDHFDDKTVLVIGAGKMGRLTLRHLRDFRPQQIWVTNRSPERAAQVAADCNGKAIPWEQLDDALAKADIVLSTTGSPELIVTQERWNRIRAKRTGGPIVILDIAIPRDFDPAIHDGDQTCLFNIDDLKSIQEQTLAKRQKHIAPAEAIVEHEQRKFVEDWSRRRNGPVIAKLRAEFDAKREAVVQQLFGRLNGKLTDADKESIKGAFQLLQNKLLHTPMQALNESAREGGNVALADALRKLFRLAD
ncbi:glutamyl-tRNA reductase [Tuwongella immobilis]|uniref:Glutamyl-tRNA reductase n=1 Tax=Tuwongella immobilis TaxID=692036 RepID=A0A6C2YU65_9BACT|nr:glutamyl-tRNA reductase [Tuwongella immobilis]VIP05036.1 glutamyl-trna reductase : Glutamyl-tRNA reductase OS=Singulisphaera acidiphila (strain ATCC BAA-1392 / DSM 18658 / VKM B-2454 / MOB10) GN=hemA PE=3 SV=1: GlutR_N: Shikimate_DH: GlutR_dimer [Tuwongella immobilis]VTS07428.1 glutamyl-trna reductase : Glutamyl-tRNA reductase OS=Singulisphaera acidiphila (strain ATCC BAA-1392 / DSM 18658 / VKM B-2454 / MOB10) GN=hemA PE=3 SV=1: GlutR_N: Shikimate_DH: GlutR_dimer [Tuwongella immobilis]